VFGKLHLVTRTIEDWDASWSFPRLPRLPRRQLTSIMSATMGEHISSPRGSFIGMKPQASKASGFSAVRNLEGYLQGKDESEVEGLVDRMGVMVLMVSQASLMGGAGKAGAAAGRP
jgi:hypothetical protein